MNDHLTQCLTSRAPITHDIWSNKIRVNIHAQVWCNFTLMVLLEHNSAFFFHMLCVRKKTSLFACLYFKQCMVGRVGNRSWFFGNYNFSFLELHLLELQHVENSNYLLGTTSLQLVGNSSWLLGTILELNSF